MENTNALVQFVIFRKDGSVVFENTEVKLGLRDEVVRNLLDDLTSPINLHLDGGIVRAELIAKHDAEEGFVVISFKEVDDEA